MATCCRRRCHHHHHHQPNHTYNDNNNNKINADIIRRILHVNHCAPPVIAEATTLRDTEARQASRITNNKSHVTRHTSHVTRHTSQVTSHTSQVTRHNYKNTSDLQGSQQFAAAAQCIKPKWHHTSNVTRHTSHVKRHVSHVTRHTSPAASPSLFVPLQHRCAPDTCHRHYHHT